MLPEWMDEDYNITNELDPEVWFVISAFFNNCCKSDSDVPGRFEDSDILML